MPCLRACLSFTVLLALPACANPFAFVPQGTAHYAGKRFLGLAGQYKGLALAPVGGRVAFRGQEGVGGRGVLFVADVDGAVRAIGPADPWDGLLRWAVDGGSLFYSDLIFDAQGLPNGGVLRHLDLASGAVAPATSDLLLRSSFMAPGGQAVADGTRVPGIGATRPVAGSDEVCWSPDGGAVALAEWRTESRGGSFGIATARAPGWDVETVAGRTYNGRLAAMAWEDATHLTVAEAVVGDFLEVTRCDAAGRPVDTARIPLDEPPAGQRYFYTKPLFARDGRRLLLSRSVLDLKTGQPVGPRQHGVVADGWLRPIAAPEDAEPIGWVDDHRVLALSGYYGDRRPLILETAP